MPRNTSLLLLKERTDAGLFKLTAKKYSTHGIKSVTNSALNFTLCVKWKLQRRKVSSVSQHTAENADTGQGHQ